MQVYSIGEALRFREQERDNFVVIDKAALRAMQGKAAELDWQRALVQREHDQWKERSKMEQSNAD